MENTLLTVLGQMRDPRYDVTLYAGIDDGDEDGAGGSDRLRPNPPAPSRAGRR